MNLIKQANTLMPGMKFVNGKAVLEMKPDTIVEPLPVKVKLIGIDEEGNISIGFN